METLEYKESQAITLKYIGKTHREIGEVIDVPKATVDEWFKSRGKLKSPYFTWKELMDGKRKENNSKNILVNDKELLTVITNLLRMYNRYILYGIQKPITKNGEPVLDENGEVRYYTIPFVPNFTDVRRAWKMQRVMRNLPTNITQTLCPRCGRRDTKFL